MGREGGIYQVEDHGPDHETLNFELVSPGDPRPGADCAGLVLGDSGNGQRIPLVRNPMVIGRSNNADLVLTDPAVSDFHARIIRHSFGYTVEDMGSAGGTFLHDRRVSHARLVDGDILRLGTTTLTFSGEPAASPERQHVARALVRVRSTLMGLAPRQVLLRRHSLPHNLEEIQALLARMPVRKEKPADGNEDAPSIDDVLFKIVRVFRFIRCHARLIAIFAATGLGLGAASFKYCPPVRAAYCNVTLYSAPRTNPIEPEVHHAQSDSMHFFAGAERDFIGREAVMATLERMGAPHPTEREAESIARRMRFENLGNNAYVASLTPGLFDRRDEWHVAFLGAHVKNYIETEVEKRLKVFIAEVDFLRSQTEAADKRLQEISQETVKFREAHSDQILAQNTLASSPAELETRRIELRGQISRLTGELEGTRSQLARGSALSQAKAQSGHSDREALAGVKHKLTELHAQGFADGHPDVQRLLSEQKALQEAVDDHLHADVTQFEKRSNLAYDSLQSQADQLGAQLKAARSELGFVEANLRSLRTLGNEAPRINARLDELSRTKDVAARQYGLLSDRLKKAEVQLQFERVSTNSRYEIAVPARLEYPPGRFAFATRLASGLGIGLLLAALVLGLSELKRQLARVAREAGESAIRV